MNKFSHEIFQSEPGAKIKLNRINFCGRGKGFAEWIQLPKNPRPLFISLKVFTKMLIFLNSWLPNKYILGNQKVWTVADFVQEQTEDDKS